MLTRALLLSAGWLTLSFLITVLRGTKVKNGSFLGSVLWLMVVLVSGALWALLTFGEPLEVFGLTLITFVFGVFWILRLPNWNALGQVLWVNTILASFLYIAYSFAVSAFTPLHPLVFVVALVLTIVEIAALVLGLTYAYESLDVCCRIRWNRRFAPLQPIPGYAPKVSLQVPTYNEPLEVVEATLRSLAQIDYPNFEVLLVDNNTPEEATWRPLRHLCEELGPPFRFLHLDKWPGYKSGALNFALTQTAPDAEIIGIIDADYLVNPNFLRDLTGYFADPSVAFVQTPQDYRDYKGNPYLEACYYGYKYFFAVSMPSRNEHNAIIFAGTMGLIRRSVLQEIGGWDEWCITEDAETSLRVLKRGYQSVFVNKAYGTGLMPYTFEGLKKQRFRWCFGGIQILKKHWEALMPWSRFIEPDNKLTLAQRYYYLFGGLQWFNEPLNLFFTLFLILGAILHFTGSGGSLRPLTGPLLVVPAIFLVVGMWRFLWVLRHTLRLNLKDAIQSMANFFSMGWTVTLGCIQGIIQPAGVFMRTPKSKSDSDLLRVVRAAQTETIIGVVCLIFAIAILIHNPSLSTIFLAALLVWQSALYLSALYYSLFSMRNQELRPSADTRGKAVQEVWLMRWAIAIALGMIIGIWAATRLPAPVETPQYARLQPVDVQVQQLVGLPAQPTPTFTASSTMNPPATAAPTGVPPATLTMTTTTVPLTGTALTPSVSPTTATTSATPVTVTVSPAVTATTPVPSPTVIPPQPTTPAPTASPVVPTTAAPPPTLPPPTATTVPPTAAAPTFTPTL